MKNIILLLFLSVSLCVSALPEEYAALDGSMTPIKLPCRIEKWWPDSLQVYFVNHVGRHGARYMSSERKFAKLENMLMCNRGNLTEQGKEVLAVLREVRSVTGDKWGLLTPLGLVEEREMAKLTVTLCPELFAKGSVSSRATAVPRVVESAYSYCFALSRFSDRLEITAADGRHFDPLLRFFTYDDDYSHYLSDGPWIAIYRNAVRRMAPVRPVRALLLNPDILSREEAQDMTMEMYSVAQSMRAAEIPFDASEWMTLEEYRKCADLAAFNRYLGYSESKLSKIPVKSAVSLLRDILDAGKIAHNDTACVAVLRFGHAETLMPLFALMDLPGTTAPDTELDAEKVAKE